MPVELLSKVIDTLLEWKKQKDERLEKQMEKFIEPVYEELNRIHPDYLSMFNEARSLIEEDSSNLSEAIRRLKSRRFALDPIRQSLRDEASQLMGAFDKPELNEFVRSVLHYFPMGDIIRGQGTAATTLISMLQKIQYRNHAEENEDRSETDREEHYELIMFSMNVYKRSESTGGRDGRGESFEKGDQTNPLDVIDFFISLHCKRWKKVSESRAVLKGMVARKTN